MKFLVALVLAATALATPVSHEKRQTANDFTNGSGCKKVVMIYARGSTELGNIVSFTALDEIYLLLTLISSTKGTLGPSLESGLDRAYPGQFAMQGVPYPADLVSNFLPDGSNQEAINTAANLLNQVASRCPNARIVAGGYSQGTAVISNAVEKLSESVKSKLDAVVFFGYTKNLQNRGVIPGFPKDKLKVICNVGDLVSSLLLSVRVKLCGRG